MCRKFLIGKMIRMLAVLLVLFMTVGVAEESGLEPKTITVSTAQEFVDAIGSNTTILLSDGVYNLSETNQDGFATDEKYWGDVRDGKELCIRNVYNLIIKGESPDCQIVVDPRDAEVLTFLQCAGITIENITAGHTIQSGVCDSGVLYFEDCSDIRVINTHMFGCGKYGLSFTSVNDVKVENSSIYECTYGIMDVLSCNNIAFTDCVFRDTDGGAAIEETRNITFDRCQFANLDNDVLFYVQDCLDIIVQNSSFINNTAEDLHTSEHVRFINNTFTGNAFDEIGLAETALPAEAAKVFEDAEWDGYEPVTSTYYQWPAVGMAVTLMRKNDHSVLCLLRDEGAGYRVVAANDRAVYQDGRVPSMYIDDGMGLVCFEYTDENAPEGLPETEGYVFCSRWYWEEEMERTAQGDWEYMLLDAYRLYPEPHEPGYPYYDVTRYSMDFSEIGLRLESRYEFYGDPPDAWETLAQMEVDAALYDLAVFDIARCNADYETLMAMAEISFENGDSPTPPPDDGDPAETPGISTGDGPLTPVQSNGKWGYANAAAEIVIPCQWESTGAFYNERAWVQEDDGRWALIDTEGNDLSAYRWDEVYPFHEGILSKDLAFVAHRDSVKGLLYGLVGMDGKVVVEAKWGGFLPATEGVARIVTGNQYGYVDHTGKVFAIPQYGFAYPFSQGLGRAAKGNLWGFITKEGTVAGQPWDDASEFSEGLARVKKDGLYGFVDTTGELVVEPVWEDARSFSEGLAIVKKDGLWGVINATGNVVAEPKWEDASSFSEGFARVNSGGLWGHIDITGNVVVSYQWDYAGSFCGGLTRIRQGSLWGYIDPSGNVVIPCEWDDASIFCDGLAAVEQNGLWGFIDTTGRIVIELQWEEVYDFDQGFAIVASNDQYGLIDTSGEIIVDLLWDDIDYFREGLACVKKDEQMGYIDMTGRVVIEPRWDEAMPFDNGFAKVWNGETRFFIDPEGRIIR